VAGRRRVTEIIAIRGFDGPADRFDLVAQFREPIHPAEGVA
jgi:hypothetical protein